MQVNLVPAAWMCVAVLGVLSQWGAVRDFRDDLRYACESGAPLRLVLLARNNLRRYTWRVAICINNLLIGLLALHRAPAGSAYETAAGAYVLASLIANEAIVVALTVIDQRVRRRVIQLSAQEDPK